MSKNILIVEDEETLRESIKRIFIKEGYTRGRRGVGGEGACPPGNRTCTT